MSESPGTILIADDNPAILLGIQRALVATGYDVRTACSGTEVMELMSDGGEQPDLLLLDVMMPGLTGLDVLRSVRADPSAADVPVVLITAGNDGGLPVSAIRDGAVDFLTKPFRLDELLARVDMHVRRSRELRRSREYARIRLQTIELIRELHHVVSAEEMFNLVTSRVSSILNAARCSLLVVEDGASTARVAASSEAMEENGMTINLHRYPEVREAVESQATVAVREVSTSPLFDRVRAEWERDGLAVPPRSVIAVPFSVASGVTGVFVERTTTSEIELGEEAVELAQQVVEALVQACGRVEAFQILLDQRRLLHDLAHTDELTGVSTRRSLLLTLKREVDVARTRDLPLSLVLLDLDSFKAVNDTCGHLAGDAVLRALGVWLRAEGSLRSYDYAGRLGGDEFMVILPATNAAGALRFAERARAHFASIPFVFGDTAVQCSLSAGTSTCTEGGMLTAEQLIAMADEALYDAKEKGGDQVSQATEACEAAHPAA